MMTTVCNQNEIHEQFSRACEQACVCGMVLLQPYLDFTGKDPAQGELKLKVWEYNSFLIDPYFRSYDASDCAFIWTQEYISKQEAESRFPGQQTKISPMSGSPQRYGSFYFLPENYNMARNDLLVLSYVWYKWKTKKKKLYSARNHQFYDFAQDANMDPVLQSIPDLEIVEIEVPIWKLAVVLNDQLMWQGENPLGFEGCPFIPVFWNYDPHTNYYDLRCRGLVRCMRDAQYLFNRRIILNHDITEATINAGWKRKIGAVANEDNLKKSGQGWDVLINEGYEMTDVEKIVPSGVPDSDMALADQLQQLMFTVSGINMESWNAENSPNASSFTVLMKQAANLMIQQKYFDQWDLSLKLLGERMLQITLNNWTAPKVKLYIGEEPTQMFYSKIFSSYETIVEEAVLTPTQKVSEYNQWIELNQQLGGIIPPHKLAEKAPIMGKKELMEILQNIEQQQQAVQSEATNIQHAFEEAKLQELYSKAANNIASAKERYGRFESNIGLLEERVSELTKNRALATKAKMEALEKLVDATAKIGAVETMMAKNQIDTMDDDDKIREDVEKNQANQSAFANEFMSKLMAGLPTMQNQMNPEEPMEAAAETNAPLPQ
ncbi:MAG: hypothetical protein KGI50_05360 [Patescibacteria group bacterium]|nr:hypothetical protein [Patescibacteria group bacterium]MDE2438766.1 hypothetical protein [Patescibacteria group bacterium]